ncbi:syntaxin-binding protein 6-like [Clavelina lepadiformis]|uniref:V-SNARE coiled-coil homology domain-containing protein n=1 Tax=Clavelina lepadiformis TaxID=159417 RepID=A0ABP0GZB6_CLALP
MTSRPHEVKHYLHKEVFHPNGERLVAFIKVLKTEPSLLSKAENEHYLCCSVTVKRPSKVFITRFRRADDGKGFQKRRHWSLEDLKKVDGYSDDSMQFDIHFDRPYKFQALSLGEKNEFLENFASLCTKYLGSICPSFENVSRKVHDCLPASEDTKSLMTKNKAQLDERGKKLSNMERNTAEMASSAQTFHQTATDLSKQYQTTR